MKWIILLFVVSFAKAQSPETVVTAFPSLRIPASSRGLSMGDGGIASASENQALYYNVSKTAFTTNFHQVSVSYLPWLTAISEDTRFINLNYVGNVSNSSAIGVGINYLNLGNMQTRDNNGAVIANYQSREFNLGMSYALQIGGNASLGAGFKFLGQNVFGQTTLNQYGICGDFSYYQYAALGDDNHKIEWGAVVSNLGAKENLPTNMGIGVGYSSVDEEGSVLGFSLDANRLLAAADLRFSMGMEYGYLNEFFMRGGVSVEKQLSGNRKFFGFGVGYKGFVFDQSWGLDFHYLVPFGVFTAVSPLQNSFGFTLKMNLGNFQ